MAKRRQPRWLSRVAVDAIHNDQLREHGGLPGLRDENVLESALARPQQAWSYEQASDVPSLAARYAFGLVKNHPYRDGNQRIGFLALVTFLGMNGYDFAASDADVVTTVVALADGRVSEAQLAAWIAANSAKR